MFSIFYFLSLFSACFVYDERRERGRAWNGVYSEETAWGHSIAWMAAWFHFGHSIGLSFFFSSV